MAGYMQSMAAATWRTSSAGSWLIHAQGAWHLATKQSADLRQWLQSGHHPLLLVLDNVEAAALNAAMMQVTAQSTSQLAA